MSQFSIPQQNIRVTNISLKNNKKKVLKIIENN